MFLSFFIVCILSHAVIACAGIVLVFVILILAVNNVLYFVCSFLGFEICCGCKKLPVLVKRVKSSEN